MTMNFHADEELVGVALIGATDLEARAIVERLLGVAGIDYFIEGSVVYSVQVHPPDLAHASEILRSSSELKDHWIQFPVE
jgi:hypothetical protein